MEDLLKRIVAFVIFVLAQVVIFSRIHLFGVATPLLFVYFILQIPLDYPRWGTIIWGFLMGLIIDIFTNTPGVASASLTIIGLIQPYLLYVFYPKDANDGRNPSVKSMPVLNYVLYASSAVFIFCLLFFTFESFNLFNFVDWILRIATSWLVTMVFILVFENFKR